MYKTENRHAKNGERILTTVGFRDCFEAGEVHQVEKAHDKDHKLIPKGSVFVEGLEYLILPSEYEVIVGEGTEE